MRISLISILKERLVEKMEKLMGRNSNPFTLYIQLWNRHGWHTPSNFLNFPILILVAASSKTEAVLSILIITIQFFKYAALDNQSIFNANIKQTIKIQHNRSI